MIFYNLSVASVHLDVSFVADDGEVDIEAITRGQTWLSIQMVVTA